jgi:hypothetical protein
MGVVDMPGRVTDAPWISPVARALAGGLVIATGAIHLYLYQEYFSVVATVGPLFLANAAAGAVVGVPILLRGGWIWPLLGAAFCAATLGAFLWSVEWGLFGYHERLHGTWQGRAAVVEIAGVVTCIAAGALAARGDGTDSPALGATPG